jgi:hypothetical protein
LLKWIKDFKPGLHTENWMILDRQTKQKGQRLILLVDWDFHTVTKGTAYMTLQDSIREPLRSWEILKQCLSRKKVLAMGPVSTESVSEVEGVYVHLLWD